MAKMGNSLRQEVLHQLPDHHKLPLLQLLNKVEISSNNLQCPDLGFLMRRIQATLLNSRHILSICLLCRLFR